MTNNFIWTGSAVPAKPFATRFPAAIRTCLAGTRADRATLSFGPNAARLIGAKRRYDPDNIFSSAISLPHHGC